MKQLILSMATLLVARKGSTNNKEIKDALHRVFENDPTFSLTQKETSAIMAELYVENNWDRELIDDHAHNVSYYQYKFVVDTVTEPGTPAPSYSNVNPSGAGSAGTQSAVATNVAQKLATTKHGLLDVVNGPYVAYVSGKPETYRQGLTANEAKKSVFKAYNTQIPGLIYDNINSCAVKYFNNNHLPKIV